MPGSEAILRIAIETHLLVVPVMSWQADLGSQERRENLPVSPQDYLQAYLNGSSIEAADCLMRRTPMGEPSDTNCSS